MPNYIASNTLEKVDTSHPAFAEAKDEVTKRVKKMFNIRGKRTVDSIHKELGRMMWENCGMARSEAWPEEQSCQNRGIARGVLEQCQYHRDGRGTEPVTREGRAAWRTFWNWRELMCIDALHRTESCGGHFRVESQTPDGEAKRDDEHFSYVVGMGVEGRWRAVGPPQGAARLRVRSPCSEELQVAMNLTLKIWRQQNAKAPGEFATYQVKDVTKDMSFLEMLDLLNEDLQTKGEAPVAFEHDCREGICGSCGFLINGVAHGGQRGTTICQLSMRFFKDGTH